jgi:hypothetical protein
MAEPVTYPCLVCRGPCERLDSGTVERIWEGRSFTSYVHRITFCPLCQIRRFQWVKIEVTDGGPTDQSYVKVKIPKEP